MRAFFFAPFVFSLAACLALAGCSAPMKEAKKQDREGPKRPNVVLILTDDLTSSDLNPNTLEHMPNLRSLMEEGTTFDNAFVEAHLDALRQCTAQECRAAEDD